MNKAQIWVGIICVVAGLVTGGLGSAAIGSAMYNKLDTEFTNHVNYQFEQDMETVQRLASIEEIQKGQTKIQEGHTRILEEIRDALRR